MIKQFIYILFITCVLGACKSEVKRKAQEALVEDIQEIMTNSIDGQLSAMAKDSLSSWTGFQNVASGIERYTSVTKSQALENAKELSLLIKNISDSIKVDRLERPDIRIRFNVLYNHSLRLNDMSTIPTVSDEEVSQEIEKMLLAFSSINEKINLIFKIAEYEKEYSDEKRQVIDSIAEVDSNKIEVSPKKQIMPKKPLERRDVRINPTRK